MLYYLICKKKKRRNADILRQPHVTASDTIECAVVLCKDLDKMPFTKVYFGVRYIDLEHNYHAWIDFVGEYEFLVMISSRLVWL